MARWLLMEGTEEPRHLTDLTSPSHLVSEKKEVIKAGWEEKRPEGKGEQRRGEGKLSEKRHL